jgi:hypothetical protein
LQYADRPLPDTPSNPTDGEPCDPADYELYYDENYYRAW